LPALACCGCRWVQDRPSACEDADAADGDRSGLSPSTHDKARAGPQDLPVPAARDGDHAAEPGVAMDITYIPMARGFVYLAVVLDWFSRRVLSWRVSITMEAAFCVETLQDALARHGKPDVFNTDQGARSSPDRLLPACSPTTALRSAWMAREPGGTTCSSNDYGAASNTRRCICGPMTASARPSRRSADTSTFTTAHQNTHLAM
jgi:hypothetical protein